MKRKKNEGKKQFSEEKIKNTREKRDTLLLISLLRRRMTKKKILADIYVVILLSLSLLLLLSETMNFGVFAEQELPIGKEFELLCQLEDFEKRTRLRENWREKSSNEEDQEEEETFTTFAREKAGA